VSKTIVEVVEVNSIAPHPHADRLDVATVMGATVVVPRGEFTKGQKVIFFPPDILLPEQVGRDLGVSKYLKHATYPGGVWKTQCRVASCRLRGQPSFGFIVDINKVFWDADALLPFGTDVSAYFQAVKYEPPQKIPAGEEAPEHPAFHKYTDIENFYRYPDAIPEGMEVRITEKIHGTNCRVGLVAMGGGAFEFMAGSHKINRKQGGVYWEPLQDESILRLLTHLCAEQFTVILFGEIYGPGIQDLDYGIPKGERAFRVFDASIDGIYMNWDELEAVCEIYDILTVPLLYNGPFYKPLVEEFTYGRTLANSFSSFNHATGLCSGEKSEIKSDFKDREGIVITPLIERYSEHLGGRMILKSVSADFQARNKAEDND
jgi:RNA ligase (TIGR02306 family)